MSEPDYHDCEHKRDNERLRSLLRECEPAVYAQHMDALGTRIAKPATLLARVRAALAGTAIHPNVSLAAPSTNSRDISSGLIMVCGVDCHPGDQHCNGYCTGRTDEPPTATDEQRKAFAARQIAEGPCCDECGKSKRDGWALYCVACLERVLTPDPTPAPQPQCACEYYWPGQGHHPDCPTRNADQQEGAQSVGG